MTLTHFL